ncbi:MAG: small multi-drug export protein [Chitinivibrionales bacterium]|nr:small multi-drug export protein [Chitinivibrionales bacterium]
MTVLLNCGMVFGLGIIELWAAIPAGFTLRLPFYLIGTCSAMGALMGVLLTIIIGRPIYSKVLKNVQKPHQEKYIIKIWEKYGIVGLGIVAPLITGTLIGTAAAIFLGSSRTKTVFWMLVGIVLWTLILTVGGVTGLAFFHKA